MGLKRHSATNFANQWKGLLRSGQGIGFLLLFTAVVSRAQSPLRLSAQAKLAPGLQAAAAQRAARSVRVSVTDILAFQHWVGQYLPAVRVSQSSASAHTLAVTGLNASMLAQLAACPFVEFVDVADRQAHAERQLNNSDLSVNAIAAVQARFPELGGQGLTVSVKEQPFDSTDIDFKGRVLHPEAFPGPPSDHATAMATLIGGAGNSHPLGRGVARQVRLATSDFARLRLYDLDQNLRHDFALAELPEHLHLFGFLTGYRPAGQQRRAEQPPSPSRRHRRQRHARHLRQDFGQRLRIVPGPRGRFVDNSKYRLQKLRLLLCKITAGEKEGVPG